MAIGRRWAGKAFGTNIGNLFLSLDGEDAALKGVLRMNEPGVGIAVYAVQGSFTAPTLTLSGQSQTAIEGAEFGQVTAKGTLNARGEIIGDWESTNGAAGTFILYPHVGSDEAAVARQAEQLHIARHAFGAVEIDREQIIKIAEEVQREFPSVVVTIVAGTEQARYLQDFRQVEFSVDQADIAKIFASKPDSSGSNQVVNIEFGPQVNSVTVQGANEAWVLGKLETLKRDIRQYERTYITNFKRWGVGVNQFLLIGAIVFLPSLPSLRDRSILIAGVLALIYCVNRLHTRYVPYAAIYLRNRRTSLFGRVWPSVASWAIGIVATALAAALAAYLQGWLKPSARPFAPSAAIEKGGHSDRPAQPR